MGKVLRAADEACRAFVDAGAHPEATNLLRLAAYLGRHEDGLYVRTEGPLHTRRCRWQPLGRQGCSGRGSEYRGRVGEAGLRTVARALRQLFGRRAVAVLNQRAHLVVSGLAEVRGVLDASVLG